MEFLQYLVKFSVWISFSWLFYRLVLAPLTFYVWNRIYLLVYACAAFVLPVIDLSMMVSESTVALAPVPAVGKYLLPTSDNSIGYTGWLLLIAGVGSLIGVVRLVWQFVSLSKLKSGSVLLHREDEISIFGSAKLEGAFSFGKNIYINTAGHSDDELKRILLHEVIHVKQKHTIDLVISELVCIVNWFNPFAWMLRKSIRQNLEYIADQNVLAGGYDRKHYQYLLLKVTGVREYNIVTHFSISDLKKRIIMMNKSRTGKPHLVKFAFAVPLLAVVLLAFRTSRDSGSITVATVAADTLPAPATPSVDEPTSHQETFNDRGYHLSVISSGGETYVVIRKKNSKAPQLMSMDEWEKNRSENERKYGKLVPPPPPPAPPAPPAPVPAVEPVAPADRSSDLVPAPPAPPQPPVAPKAPKKKRGKKDYTDMDLIRDQQRLVQAQADIRAHQEVLREIQADLQNEASVLRESRLDLHAIENDLRNAQSQLSEAQIQFELQRVQQSRIDLQKEKLKSPGIR